MTESEPEEINEEVEPIENQSTKAENLRAWKELLSSPEVNDTIETIFEKLSTMFGRSPEAIKVSFYTDIGRMITAFIGIGTLAGFDLIADGTAGALVGIIIGYFFKRDS